MHATLGETEHEFGQKKTSVKSINLRHGEWMDLDVLKFDEMKVKEKLIFNPHKMELVGFVGGAINNDVINEEFRWLSQQHNEDKGKDDNGCVGSDNQQHDTAKHLLLFISTSWDKKQHLIKRAVARYAVGAKSTGSDLAEKLRILFVICSHVGLLLIRYVAMVQAKMLMCFK